MNSAHTIDQLWTAQPKPIRVVLIESDRANRRDNIELLDLAERFPLVAAVIGRLDLSGDACSDEFAELTEHPAGGRWRGARIVLRRDIDDPWDATAASNASMLGSAGRVLEILAPSDRLSESASIARQVDCSVVVDHLGLPPWHGTDEDWSEWERQFAELSRVTTVVTKLGFLPGLPGDSIWVTRVQRAATIAFEYFGADRLMYASNWPVPADPTGEDYPFASVLSLIEGLSPSERDAVSGNTAREIYGV
ncbi:amidohydrolase family protein [soil metagenome]